MLFSLTKHVTREVRITTEFIFSDPNRVQVCKLGNKKEANKTRGDRKYATLLLADSVWKRFTC